MHKIFFIISDILSITIFLSSVILKIPQIVTICQNKSADGLSIKAYLLELSSYSTSLLYNYVNGHAILSYAEYPALVLQDFILIGCIFHYSKVKIQYFVTLVVVFALLHFVFATGIASKTILTLLIPCTTPVSGFSKVLMLVAIIRAQNADSVSLLTWILSIFTNAGRIYTISLDSGDMNLLVNFSVSTLLSTAVFLSAFYYKKIKVKTE